MVDTLGTLTAEAKQFYDKRLLMRAKPILKIVSFGQARNIPKNSGNQVSFRRFNTLTTATSALTEGVTPTPASLSQTEITGTAAQYGNYVTISDAVDMMGIDPVIREATDVLGENAGQSVEEIIRAEIVTGTSIIYGTGSTRGAQSAANPITLLMVRKAVRTLKAADALPFYGGRNENGLDGMYAGWIHPYQFHDLQSDTTVLNTFTYSDPDKLWTLNMPELSGVAWCVSTKAPAFLGQGSAGADVYGAVIVGRESFGVVNVGGSGRFSTHVKPIGSSGTADPLDQRGTVGWKSYQLPKILNNNFMVRIETGVTS